MVLDLAGRTHVGVLRAGKPNEDALYVRAEPVDGVVAFAVADGVGGAPGGDRASAAAVEAFAALAAPAGSTEAAAEALVVAVDAASEALSQLGEQMPALAGAGSTIVFAYASAERAWIANVGDSRGYHWRDGTLRQVTVDHSWVQREVEAGRIAPHEARMHPRRNLITRALNTTDEQQLPDLFEVALAPGDRILLCTDGLHGALEDETIETILGRDGSAEALADALIDAALDAGGPDNVAVTVLCVVAGAV